VYTQQNEYASAERLENVHSEPDINTLINKYKKPLYNLCFRLTLNRSDADDLFQETWIKAAQTLGRVDSGYFRQWLFRVCINRYKDDYRKDKRRKDVLYNQFDSNEQKDFILENTNYALSAEEEYEAKMSYQTLMAHINLLSHKLKIPMVLYYFEQLSYKDIAEIMNIPEGTVKSRLNAAKAVLKKELNGEI